MARQRGAFIAIVKKITECMLWVLQIVSEDEIDEILLANNSIIVSKKQTLTFWKIKITRMNMKANVIVEIKMTKQKQPCAT